MVALALLFILIIGLQFITFWSLRKFFEAYTSLNSQNHIHLLENSLADKKLNNHEINSLIEHRLIELERQFSSSFPSIGQQEILVSSFKKLTYSYLAILRRQN